MWRKQTGESSYNFGGNSRPNCNPLCQTMEKKMQIKVKLNDYWMNLYKN